MREMKPDSQEEGFVKKERKLELELPFENNSEPTESPEKSFSFGQPEENFEGTEELKEEIDYEQEINELKGGKPGFWKEEAETDEKAEEEAYRIRREIREKRLRKRKRKQKLRKLGLALLLIAVFSASGFAAYKKSGKTIDFQMPDIQKFLSMAVENLTGKKAENKEEAKEEQKKEETKETGAAPVEEEKEEETKEEIEKVSEEDLLIEQADFYAAQYNYDKAIRLLKKDSAYETSEKMQNAVKGYEETKASCVSWPLEEVTHVFYHSLIVDTAKAFDGDYKEGSYNQVMTTIEEFNKITQTMYDKGYVMVSVYDMATVAEDGTMQRGEILLPPGKIPFVLSQDDVSYYHYMDGDGFATKLIVDEDGKVRNEYVEDDGSISVGDYDMVPLIDRFVEAHPDFSYRGAKGIIALTGYNGILGYRTDESYETRPDDIDLDKAAWLDAHPDFSLKKEREAAKKVADAMRENGWLFASHTWGHKNIGTVSMERLQTDTQKFKENIDPLIGGTDIIIFAFGTDLVAGGVYSGELYEYLKGQGYRYYCNVDSSKYYVQITDEYFRQGRRNLDGYRMYYNPDMLTDLFDASEVFDQSRPLPIPPMG